MLEISILTLLLCETCIVIRRAVMLEISILTLLLYETCIVIRKSNHVRDIDSDCVVIRDLHRY